MVKKWIVILIISVLLIVACVVEYFFVNKSFDFLHDQLQIYQTYLDKDKENINTKENVEFVESLHKKWHIKVNGLKAVIWHTGIKDIEIGLSRIKNYTKENDYKEASTELNALIDYVQHYKEDFTLSIENLL